MDPRMRQRRVEVERANGRRRMRVVVVVASTVTFLALSLGVLHTGLFGVRHIRVIGHSPVPESRLLTAAGLHRGEPLIDVDGSRAARRIEGLAWVQAAQVRREWPTTVQVTVTRRAVLAQIPTGASTTGPVADSTGRILTRSPVARPGLPMLLGVGAPGRVGLWVPGSAGWRRPLGSVGTQAGPVAAALSDATGPVEAALAFMRGVASLAAGAGGLGTYALERVDVAAGTISAVVTPGSVAVVVGPPTSLAAKATALVTMLRSQHLAPGSTLDLEVPDRPTVTPAAQP
jgi:cell division septal protein FtsQ